LFLFSIVPTKLIWHKYLISEFWDLLKIEIFEIWKIIKFI